MRRSRALTADEIRLASSFFGKSINYAAVKIHDGRYTVVQPKNSGMTPRGELYMYGCYSADYAAEPAHMRALFLHEMTHVWQYQNKLFHPVVEAAKLQLKHKFNYAGAYSFSLDPKKDLTAYGMEQQAAIIEEYYLLKHSLQRGQCTDDIGTAEKQVRFEKVLENFLKNPAYAKRKSFFSKPQRFGR